MGAIGRPTKLTPEVQERICNAIRVGATYELAAQFGGISYETFRAWQRAADEGDSAYSGFSEAVKLAEAEGAMRWLALIDAAAAESWQAAAWKLERRYPADYGRNDKLRVEAKGDGPLVLKWEGGDGGDDNETGA